MKTPPKVGTVAEQRFVVEAAHLIDFSESGMPAVLCTPALIGFLERTAREALVTALEPDESSVGVEIEVNHFAPTPPGQTVTCLARIVHVEGRRITFQVEARDEHELVARGMHRRQIIRVRRFAEAVARKTGQR